MDYAFNLELDELDVELIAQKIEEMAEYDIKVGNYSENEVFDERGEITPFYIGRANKIFDLIFPVRYP